MDVVSSEDELKIRIREMIDSVNVLGLRKLFHDDAEKGAICDLVWDIVPMLCQILTQEVDEHHPDLIDFTVEALGLLAKSAGAKELLIVLLEQADTFLSDLKYKVLLEPIQQVLLRLTAKRYHSLHLTLSTLFTHIEILQLPDDMDLDGEEKKLLDLDPKTDRLIENINLYVDFMKPFIDEIPKSGDLNDDLEFERKHLLVALMNCLAKKLVYLFLNNDNDRKSATWLCCEKIMNNVAYLCRDMYKAKSMILDAMLEEDDRRTAEKAEGKKSPITDEETPTPSESNPYPHVSVACFHYLLYVEQMNIDQLPSVLNHGHIFEHCLPSIALMFSSPRSVIVDKGAKLALKLLDYTPLAKFPHDMIDFQEFTAFMENLLQAVVMCQSKDVRTLCVKIFPRILEKFDARGRHTFFIFSFNRTGHAGVKGHLLHLLKGEVLKSFDGTSGSDSYMTEIRLSQVIRLLLFLPDGATTDLLDQSDLIVTCLNFVRYLVIRDKTNQTGIWNQILGIEKNYFVLLRKALDLSKAHYELEWRNCIDGKSVTEDLQNTGTDCKVTVAKRELAVSMPKEQQLSIIQSALNTFELIEGLLSRVEELINVGQPMCN